MSAVEPLAPAPEAFPERHRALLRCPATGHPLVAREGGLHSAGLERSFATEGGIGRLFWANDWQGRNDVTDEVQAFYEEHPFPGYDELDSPWSLRAKAGRGLFARALDDAIPADGATLEVGCGTGQLSNLLGLTAGRVVFGADLCAHSLTLAESFRREHRVPAVRFVQMNLFRPCFAEGSFDLVISNGVLHHTSDPSGGFASIAPLVKPGGHIAIGLYNTWGRMSTDLRRWMFQRLPRSARWLDPRWREEGLARHRREIWFADQYLHPHESKHTMDEVLGWFDKAGFDFVRGLPAPTLWGGALSTGDGLFAQQRPGNPVGRLLIQLGMMVSGGVDGGFFILIGRRRS